MARTRFADSESLTTDDAVQKVWDTLHERHRVSRPLWNLPTSEWEEARERFRDLAQLQHPALPRLVAVGEENETLVLVEDFVTGRTLTDQLHDEGPPTLERAVRWLLPVVHAVGAMHQLFMGHGGIDTGSVVIDDDDRAYLVGAGAREALPDMDFGALAEVIGFLIAEPTDETRALLTELRNGKLRDCAKLGQRLRELVPDVDIDLDPTLAFDEPLTAEVEDWSESDDALDFEWAGMGDELDAQRRADDRKMLQWFGLGTAVIAVVGLVSSIDLASEIVLDPPTDVIPAEDIELASIAGDDEMPAPEPRVNGLGKWRMTEGAGRRHPSMTASIAAENPVQDRMRRAGRPLIHLRCHETALSVTVTPGVETLEAVIAKDQTYAKHAALAFTWEGQPPEHLKGQFLPDTSDIAIPSPADVLAGAPRAESLYLTYTPFASETVIAIFDVRGMDRALATLGRHCALP